MKCAMHRWVPVLAFTLAAACAHHTDLSRESTQNDFGVNMARMNLWREAMFRFRRAVEMNPQNPMAHNNLAVAYEANGDFENARKEYLEALRLDRSNDYIKKNYSRFVEFLARNKKRTSQRASDAAAPAPPSVVQHPTAGGGTPVKPVGAGPEKPVAGDPGVIPRPQPPPPPPPSPPPSPNPPQGGAL